LSSATIPKSIAMRTIKAIPVLFVIFMVINR
jgi:hypothetical protein